MLPPRYVAILTGKFGELEAIARLRPAEQASLTPLIDVPPIPQAHPPSPGDERPRVPPDPEFVLRKLLKGLAQARGGHDTMLDLAGFEQYRPDGQHPVTFAVENSTGVPPIIVASNRSCPAYLDALASANTRLAGRALRLHLSPTMTADQVAADAASLVDQLGTVSPAVDVVLDLGDLRDYAGPAQVDLSSVVEALRPHAWRSLTMAGTSLPQALEPGGFKRVHRGEWNCWIALQDSPLGGLVGFGDYGVTGPRPQDDDPQYAPAPHLRYLADDYALLLWKGRRPDPDEGGAVEMGQTYQDLCKQVVNRSGYRRPSFAGRTFSWGDRQIWETAEGIRGTGNPTNWVQFSTNHHLTMVLRHLKTYYAAIAA